MKHTKTFHIYLTYIFKNIYELPDDVFFLPPALFELINKLISLRVGYTITNHSALFPGKSQMNSYAPNIIFRYIPGEKRKVDPRLTRDTFILNPASEIFLFSVADSRLFGFDDKILCCCHIHNNFLVVLPGLLLVCLLENCPYFPWK